ncbi:MAG: sugar phosphate nucleotidyltransferase [Syntrophales bacterium]|nr:sugar phosphate nucleotidyltransferase [Syntrophales bacterium]
MFAVIMAGGKGTRFWPRSRHRLPKHLLDITGERTIIQETVDRIAPLIPPERVLIVTGAAHAAELKRQLPEIPGRNILVEPTGRNTAPCIGLAAAFIRRFAGDEVMIVLPSDHLITDEVTFRRILATAAAAAQRGEFLVTIGIRPTGPETGYGYIEQGPVAAHIHGEPVYRVTTIREKPSRSEAEELLRQGRFLWNSGMFVWRSTVILAAIRRFLPDIYAGITAIEEALGTPREGETTTEIYQGLRSISIDYGVMEKADNVLIVPGAFGWSDVGSWDALYEVSPRDEQGNATSQCRLFTAVDARGNYVYSPGKAVALVGVEDLIIVDTPDALLICRRGASQEVKRVVDGLEGEGRDELL